MIVPALAAATALVGCALCAYAVTTSTSARLSHGREYRNSSSGRPCARIPQQRHGRTSAALAMTAAFVPCLQSLHSLFKNAVVLRRWHGAELRPGSATWKSLGGLIHKMPLASFPAFLTGCVVDSAPPPLNGFVSEWLTLSSNPAKPRAPRNGAFKIFDSRLSALVLALSAAGACRARGVFRQSVWVSRSSAWPRSPGGTGDKGRRADCWSARGHPGFLAALCLLAGVLPGFVIDALAPLRRRSVAATCRRKCNDAGLAIVPVSESRSSYDGLLALCLRRISGLPRPRARSTASPREPCAAARPGIAAIPTQP